MNQTNQQNDGAIHKKHRSPFVPLTTHFSTTKLPKIIASPSGRGRVRVLPPMAPDRHIMYKRIYTPVGTFKMPGKKCPKFFWAASEGVLTAEIAGSAEEDGEIGTFIFLISYLCFLLCVPPRSPRLTFLCRPAKNTCNPATVNYAKKSSRVSPRAPQELTFHLQGL